MATTEIDPIESCPTTIGNPVAIPIETARVEALRAGAPDDNGRPAELAIANGGRMPCRHCLSDVPAGKPYLIAALRPFSGLGPYAETGPVFFCAETCSPWAGDGPPPILTTSPTYMIRGYSAVERILYGTGAVVPADALWAEAKARLARPDVVEVHVRSASNGCYQCRITRPRPVDDRR